MIENAADKDDKMKNLPECKITEKVLIAYCPHSPVITTLTFSLIS